MLISVLKEKPPSATAIVDAKNVMEFAPIPLNITSVKAYQAKQEREARTMHKPSADRSLSDGPISGFNSSASAGLAATASRGSKDSRDPMSPQSIRASSAPGPAS